MDVTLPDDYLSPRSKVAKLLEEIDDAPTPSPQSTQSDSVNASRYATHKSTSPPPRVAQDRVRRTLFEEDESGVSSENDSDDESAPVRPLGRAARRMLEGSDDDKVQISSKQRTLASNEDDDLYNLTPVKPSEPRPISREQVESPPLNSLRSPEETSLVVSPGKLPHASALDSDDDLPDNPMLAITMQSSFKRRKLVAGIRREKGTGSLSSPSSPPHATSSVPMDDSDDDLATAATEKELEKILSDASRPARKASKKALLEMERETQRLAREQALAHQMKVKKKFTTTDLFARFNFRQSGVAQAPAAQAVAVQSSSSPARSTDNDAPALQDQMVREPVSTPPSSPPTPWDAQKAMVDRGALAKMVPVRQDSLASIASNEGDIIVPEQISEDRPAKRRLFEPASGSPSKLAVDNGKLRLFAHRVALPEHSEDVEDDLDILQPMPSHLQMFDRVKPTTARRQTHSKALHALKHLAHLNHDSTSNGKNSHTVVNPVLLNAQLIARAKGQARQAQQERLEELKAKGVVIMSAEEQEKDAEQLEDLLEKARQEAQELRKKERAAAKQNNGDADEALAVASDDEDEDGDWNENQNEPAENEDDESEIGDDNATHLVDVAAEESDASAPAEESDEDEQQYQHHVDVNTANHHGYGRRTRKAFVIDDEEDDEHDHDHDNTADSHVTAPVIDSSVKNGGATEEADPFAAFGFGGSKPAFDFMSPTQAFNATMQTPSQYARPQLNHTPSIRAFDDSPLVRVPLPIKSQSVEQPAVTADESQSQLVPASQLAEDTQPIRLDWETQMPETPVPALRETTSNLTETPGWEPSQDAGLPMSWTAARRRQLFSPVAEDDEDHETQSTVRMRISESPEVVIPQRKGRLSRGVRRQSVDLAEDEPALPKKAKNAFSEMQKRRLETLDNAQRAEAEREMRNMMDEQAEESEDEYAGLGGDDSNMIAPETAEDRAMIDESNIEVDEDEAREMAKFYAERQRAAEEEATSKLYKDLTTGALRRRQGVGWELDEDEDEIAARRRQMRQREEARKRRLLMQDENVKSLLEGKGNTKGREAFFRTIGDDDENDDQDDLLQLDAEETGQQSAGEGHSQASQAFDGDASQPLREISPNKRPRDESGSQQARPASKIRRTHVDEAAFSRPTSMLQVRESLSFLLDDPSYADLTPPGTNPGSIDDDDENDHDGGSDSESIDAEREELARQNDGGFAPNHESMESQAMPPPPLPAARLPASQRRTPASKSAVVDRLSLRRGSSSSSNSSSSTSSWSAWSTGSNPTSKVPSLLRRATSNLSNASNANERGVSYNNGPANANERGVSIGNGHRVGGSKKSSLAYQARAEERRVLLERSEKKRIDGRRKMAELRRQQGGALGGASFTGGQWE